MRVRLRWREQNDTGSKDLVVMATTDLPNPSYEFGHLLRNTGSCLEAFIHAVNSLSHKTMSLVVYLMVLHQILRLFSDGVVRRLCTVNRKFIWRIYLWSISRPYIRIRLRSPQFPVRFIECRTKKRYRWCRLLVHQNFHASHHEQ